MTLRLEAFAKVNRSLVVVGKRPDGYHELVSVFQTVDLSDELTFEDGERLELVSSEPALAGDDNLVLRAARALADAAGVPCRGRVRLRKRIPWGAGLGGGSSNAAAALRGFAALWALPVPEEDLHALAAGLGSDVNFFLVGGRARGTGRGERVQPLADGPAEWLVLLSPAFPLSTPEVFRALKAPPLTGPAPAPMLPGSDPGSCPDRNDLEPAAESLRGEVRWLREALTEAGALSSRLSGSGSTVFGVFRDEASARAGVARLPRLEVGTRVRVVRTVSRLECAQRSTPRLVASGG